MWDVVEVPYSGDRATGLQQLCVWVFLSRAVEVVLCVTLSSVNVAVFICASCVRTQCPGRNRITVRECTEQQGGHKRVPSPIRAPVHILPGSECLECVGVAVVPSARTTEIKLRMFTYVLPHRGARSPSLTWDPVSQSSPVQSAVHNVPKESNMPAKGSCVDHILQRFTAPQSTP